MRNTPGLGVLLAVLGCRQPIELGDGGGPSSSAGASQAPSSAPDTPKTDRPALSSRGPQPPAVTCPERERPSECETRGDASLGVRVIGTLLEPRQVTRNGVLTLDVEGNIACVGCDCGEERGELVIDCPDVVVSPGLVNLHDHLGYAGTPPLSHPGEYYEHRNDWRLGENGHSALSFAGGASANEVLAHELRMVLGGATSIVGAGGRRGFLRNLELSNRTEGLLAGPIRAETFPLDDARGEVDSAACEFGKRPDSASSVEGARAYLAHVGEGVSERATDELRCALGSLDLIHENSAIVHAMALSRSDAGQLAERGASVVWSPRSNLDLYGRTAPVALLSSLGVRVALGTDWLASGSMNLLRELDCASSYNRHVLGSYFSAFELWRMVTQNAAWALGAAGRFAELKRGLAGDIALFNERADDAYLSVVSAGSADVRLVLRQGSPLYGDAELVSAFTGGGACEALDVCGFERRVCSSETGSSLAELLEAGQAVYPLFSCEAPPNEPSCEALVESECPAAELDCSAPSAAPAWDLADADADGVPDVADSCPRRPDPEQSDRDRDGRGDACDVCPSFDPGIAPCPVSVAELRTPGSRLPDHSPVVLRALRVTALSLEGSKGFYAEDGDRAPYSGIFVYTADAAPKVAVGELIDVRGYFESYQGTDELTDIEVLSRVAAETDYAPLLVEPAELGDEAPDAAAFASLLVRIEHATVESTNPDAPKDYDETGLRGGLRLDDLLTPELDNFYAVGTELGAIVGIAGFSFGHHKLYPRSLTDLEADGG